MKSSVFLGVLVVGFWMIFGLARTSTVKHVDGDLKLNDGENDAAGTVSVFRGYTWGRVCDDNWSILEANVVCRQLGLGFAVRALKRNHFHSISGRKFIVFFVKQSLLNRNHSQIRVRRIRSRIARPCFI